jgi:hypothetical protein
MTDWNKWHEPYRDATSDLSRRLAVVQRLIRAAIADVESDELRIISMCAGDGRDVIGVLSEQPRRPARALLVEADAQLVEASNEAIAASGLEHVIASRQGDAADMAQYQGYAPADIVLACGVFGNISDEDDFNTITRLPQMTRPGGTVLWTRSRRAPDFTPQIREQFETTGFTELDFVAPNDVLFSVGAARYNGVAQAFDAGQHLFTFIT